MRLLLWMEAKEAVAAVTREEQSSWMEPLRRVRLPWRTSKRLMGELMFRRRSPRTVVEKLVELVRL